MLGSEVVGRIDPRISFAALLLVGLFLTGRLGAQINGYQSPYGPPAQPPGAGPLHEPGQPGGKGAAPPPAPPSPILAMRLRPPGVYSRSQNGDICPPHSATDLFDNPSEVKGDSALIGAAPFDLGALLQGDLAVSTPAVSVEDELYAAIVGEVFGSDGMSFARGGFGTVGNTTGTFVHPFTLLNLPADNPKLGLYLGLTYRSNDPTLPSSVTDNDQYPFGPNITLSGLDFVFVEEWHVLNVTPSKVLVYRGDGLSAEYEFDVQGASQASPSGIRDSLEWISGGFERYLQDGRVIRYDPEGSGFGDYFLRKSIEDRLSNYWAGAPPVLTHPKITYQYDAPSPGPLRQLDRIIDSRGVIVDFTWIGDRVHKVAVDTAGLYLGYSYDVFEIDFAYTGGRLSKIEYPAAAMVHDSLPPANEITVATEEISLYDQPTYRPAVSLLYDGEGRLEYVKDATDDDDPQTPALPVETKLKIAYDEFGGWVTSQSEGDSPSDPTHGFDFSAPTQPTYVDPRGVSVGLIDDSNGRVESVTVDLSSAPPSAGLLPRSNEATSFQDHSSVTWTLTYNSSCCSLPETVTTPEGRKYEFIWLHGRLDHVKVTPAPQMPPSPVLSPMIYDFEYDLHTDSAGHLVSVDLKKYWDPSSQLWEWIWTYDGSTGVLNHVIAKTPAYTTVDGNLQGSNETKYAFGSRGRLDKVTQAHGSGDDLVTDYVYRDAPAQGANLLHKIVIDPAGQNVATVFEVNDLGGIVSIERGENSQRTIQFSSDLYYRNHAEVTPPVGTEVPTSVTTRRYYDRRGNLTVLRHDNRDGTGQTPIGARPWVETQWIHDVHDRVAFQRVDQAPLDKPAIPADILVTELNYYDTHQVRSIKLPDTSLVDYVVDGHGLLYKTIRNAAAVAVEDRFTPAHYYYDREGRVVATKGAKIDAGHSLYQLTEYLRDGFGRVWSIRDAEDGRVDLTHDAMHRVTSRIISDESVAPPLNVLAKTTWTYNEIGQELAHLRHDDVSLTEGFYGLETWRRYGSRGELLEVEFRRRDPNQSVPTYGRGTSWEYDSAGRVTKVSDQIANGSEAPGNATEYVYENLTNSIANTNRVFKIKSVAKEGDDFEAPPTNTTTRTQETELTYDLIDRMTSRKVLNESGGLPADVTHVYEYDSFGHQVVYRDSNGAGVDRLFDPLGRMRGRTEVGEQGDTNPTTTGFVWNDTEVRVKRTDGMTPGRVTDYIYDRIGRLVEVRHPGYDPLDPTRHRRTFSYNDAGQLETVDNGRGQSTTFGFDLVNRFEERELTTTSGLESLSAVKEQVDYDAMGRITRAETFYEASGMHLPLVRVSTVWDTLSRKVTDTFKYFGGSGGADRVVTYDYTNSQAANEDYMWRRKLEYPSGLIVETDPDGVGKPRLMRLYDPDLAVGMRSLANYRYDGSRPVERQLFYNGTDHQDTHFTWDGHRRLSEMRVENGSGSDMWKWEFGMGDEGHLLTEKYYESGSYLDDGSKFHKLTEFYSLAGSKIGVSEPDIAGDYDSADADREHSYLLDRGHNRQQHTIIDTDTLTTNYTVESDSHRYSDVDGQPYTWDGEGNLKFDGKHLYKYDFRNRLSEVYLYVPSTVSSSSSSSSSAMQSTAQANTTGTGINRNQTTYTVSDAEQDRLAVASQEAFATALTRIGRAQGLSFTSLSGLSSQSGSGGGQTQSSTGGDDGTLVLVSLYGYDVFNRRVYRYVADDGDFLFSAFDGWREIEEISSPLDGTSEDERAYVWGAGLDELLVFADWSGSNWTKYFGHQDRIGSTHGLVGISGQLVETYRYDPYGKPMTEVESGAFATGNPYTWTGRRYDPETKWYYFRNRYMSPALGRFVTADPLGVWADVLHYGNPYAYVGNAPLSFVDPLGMQTGVIPYQIPGGPQIRVPVPSVEGSWEVTATLSKPVVVEGHPLPIYGITTTIHVGSAGYSMEEAEPMYKAEDIVVKQAIDSSVGAVGRGAGAAWSAAKAAARGLSRQVKRLGGYLNRCFGFTSARTAAVDPNKIRHVFGNAAHNLDDVAAAAGGAASAYEKMQKRAQAALDAGELATDAHGVFETVINVGGIDVTVRGAVVDGVAKIGTAWR